MATSHVLNTGEVVPRDQQVCTHASCRIRRRQRIIARTPWVEGHGWARLCVCPLVLRRHVFNEGRSLISCCSVLFPWHLYARSATAAAPHLCENSSTPQREKDRESDKNKTEAQKARPSLSLALPPTRLFLSCGRCAASSAVGASHTTRAREARPLIPSNAARRGGRLDEPKINPLDEQSPGQGLRDGYCGIALA